jgi:hypothetical protein
MALQGPFTLSMVYRFVESETIGVYILSRNGRDAHYVGRSDSDLAGRIVQSSNQGRGYTSFWFDYASSAMQAYKYECELYHKYNPPDNSVHPAVPPLANWRCPVPGCAWSYQYR